MNFAPAPRRQPRESIVPMINVVFLLLIFFLMTASLEPSPPFDVSLPQAESPLADRSDRILYLSPTGDLAFSGQTGPFVLDLLAQQKGPVILRADAASPASTMARVMADLAARGITQVTLATTGVAP